MVCCSFGGHSTPQFLQCRMSAGSADLIAFNLSSALVTAPVKPDLDFLTEARSAGILLLEDMVHKEEKNNRMNDCLSLLRKDLSE